MKTHYDTLWHLFDDLASEYKFEVPLISGGIGYGEYQKYHFQVSPRKMLHVQIYRLDSGRYEFNGYIL